MKPGPSTKHVYTQSIPECEYSIRLFPGSFRGQEWGMDFVNTATGEPVNSPFPHELWCVQNADTPWLEPVTFSRLSTIESSFGIGSGKLLPGEEKYILRDGLTCLLKRVGKQDVRFTVPMRRDRRPEVPEENAHVLEFPKLLCE